MKYFSNKTLVYTVFILFIIILGIVLSIFVRRTISDGKHEAKIWLCQYVKLSLLNLQNAVINAFPPSDSVGDVFLSIDNSKIMIIPGSMLRIDVNTLDIYDGFKCDPMVVFMNPQSTWDNIYFSSNPDSSIFTPFRVYTEPNFRRYIVVKSFGSPACSNAWVEINNVLITNFEMNDFASTLGIVSTLPEKPHCIQLSDSELVIKWDFLIRSKPTLLVESISNINVVSGYCGAEWYPPYQCLHDRKHSPCPNDKLKLDDGVIHCDAEIPVSITTNMTLQFTVTINFINRNATIHDISILLNSFEFITSPEFHIYHEGFKNVEKYIPSINIDDLIDTNMIKDAIHTNVDNIVNSQLPKLISKVNEYLMTQDITLNL